jgi:hypothetical protein
VARREHPESIDAASLGRQVADSRDQLQATSEVLAVIGRGAFELEPVFETVARHALRLCSADIGVIWQRAGDRYRAAHVLGGRPEYQALMLGAQRRRPPERWSGGSASSAASSGSTTS